MAAPSLEVEKLKLKTWEMIKALSENPNQVFVRSGDNRRFKTSTKIEDGKIVSYYVSDLHAIASECIALDDEWELVRESVDFMTAIKAFSEGKIIACKSYFGLRTYTSTFSKNALIDYQNASLTWQEILHGQWYIED